TAGGELVMVVQSALVVVAQDDGDVALCRVDVAFEAVQLADLRLGGPPEMVGVRGVVRLLPDGVRVRALVLVVDEIADAHDLITTLDDRSGRLECRGAGCRGLEHAPELGPLSVDVAHGYDLDHPSGSRFTRAP